MKEQFEKEKCFECNRKTEPCETRDYQFLWCYSEYLENLLEAYGDEIVRLKNELELLRSETLNSPTQVAERIQLETIGRKYGQTHRGF